MSRASRTTVAGAMTRAALVPPAAVLVHQLRYLLAFRGGAADALRATGHSYLHSLAPWIISLLALAAGGFLGALGRALAGRRGPAREPASFAALWLACSACLVVIFAGQELLEGAFLAGHPTGLSGILGYGGWWALPAAGCVGLVLAAVFHVADRLLDTVAAAGAPAIRSARGSRRVRRPAQIGAPAPAPLAAGWSGRGPPAR